MVAGVDVDGAGLEWTDVPADHEIFNLQFKVGPRRHTQYARSSRFGGTRGQIGNLFVTDAWRQPPIRIEDHESQERRPQQYGPVLAASTVMTSSDSIAVSEVECVLIVPALPMMDPAVIEIVSPGNKDGTNGLKTFVRKAGKLLRRGVHLLIIDLFPPSVRDRQRAALCRSALEPSPPARTV